MCGIAGFADSSRALPLPGGGAELLREMCAVIRHRGPDDEGRYTAPGVGLGMRRLSIIDVASGQQPIANEDRSVFTVFNGEIYNFRELRKTLETRGHHFSTHSDTEVIVHGYEEWGDGVVEQLHGMFGLAVWDVAKRRLLLARDRMGIKPLCYTTRNGRLYFGSEIKSILCASDVPRTIDLDALNHYLSFLYTPADTSIFRGVHKLPPGHLLTWHDGEMSVVPYWQAPAQESFTGSEDEAVEQLRDVLLEAVRSHLVSDVPLGAFLSGGLDSSVVVALMAKVTNAPVKTFSIGFDEPEFDERAHARRVAEHCHTDHHEVVVRPDGLAILDSLIEHFDEPFGDASAIPTWYVSEVARRDVTVVLSGDGGDELFGGYDRYLPHPRVDLFDRIAAPGLRQAASFASARMPHGAKGKNFLRHVARDQRGRYLDAVRFFSPDEKPSLLSADVMRTLQRADPEAAARTRFDRYAHLPWASQMMHFDAETYLPEDILTKVDRMSMAHSIESRVPLLDDHVVTFASTLPAAMKIRNGRRKHILKRVAERLLPADIIDRRKQGFAVPLGTWCRGGLRELFADTLLSPSSLQRGYFQPRFIRRIVDEHLTGRRDHTLQLWQLVVFERWHSLYVDRSPMAEQPMLVAAGGR